MEFFSLPINDSNVEDENNVKHTIANHKNLMFFLKK